MLICLSVKIDITMKGFISIVFLTILLAGCQTGSYLQATPTYYMSSEQGLGEGVVMFSDDFTSSDTIWGRTNSALGSRVAYEHQGLRIVVNETNTDLFSTAHSSMQDVRIAVDASKLGGPDDNYFGVICRMQDNLNYYAFLISSDGYYGITKVIDGQVDLLSSEHMDFSAIINRSRGTNRVRGDCMGSVLSMYVNGQKIASVQDGTFQSGKFGVIAGSNDEIGVDILFDNFFVYQP